MIKTIGKKISGGKSRQVKTYEKRVKAINALEEKYKEKSLDHLKAAIAKVREQLADKGHDEQARIMDENLDMVFAIVREASRQILGQRHYDVQLIGGMTLHEGKVAEMRTGEGKTLVATLPAVLNGLTGRGVHVVSVNDYLVQRDAGWNGEIYDALGLSVAVIIAEASYIYDPEFSNDEHEDKRFRHLRPCSRQEAYNADITYGTNNEFGFDYLRDNMVNSASKIRQEQLHFAIVDEVDSILIDEARTPLIISGAAGGSGTSYDEFAKVARQLKPEHYEVDEKRKASTLTDDGVQFVQEKLGIDNLYAPENVRLIYHMDQALSAQVQFHREKHYIVSDDGEVIIVDEFTGRLMHGRRYNEGLHQAIEAKEGVKVQEESSTLATITFQNFFRMYHKLTGMTGTAETEKDEFYEIYKLDVVVIPTNKAIQRKDLPDRIYPSEEAKFKAVIKEVKAITERGQAVLIGTASIEKNVVLSNMLAKAGVEHNVLNAKNHEREASIVAAAGKPGAVTLATNIAGRGTDIVLDPEVKEAGGLAVVGSERHESRRIDNQLRGRCGRQGDPGQTQFYVSTDDELMRVFGGDKIQFLLDRIGADEDTPVEHKAITRGLEQAQKRVEQLNFEVRKNTVKFDDVINRHRTSVYRERRDILQLDDLSEQTWDLVNEELTSAFNAQADDLSEFSRDFKSVHKFDSNLISKLKKEENHEKQLQQLTEVMKKSYDEREDRFGKDTMRALEKEIMLRVIDNLWMQHLENMHHLRQGIGLRQVGGRDPLVEYRREGQVMFDGMRAQQRSEVARFLYNAEPVVAPPEATVEPVDEIETSLTKAAEQSQATQAKLAKETAKSSEKAAKKPVAVKPADRKVERKKDRTAKKKKKAARKRSRK